MADHHDESLMDKVKNAFGMGDDKDRDTGHEAHATGATDDADAEALDGDRADGWAGVPQALSDDTTADPGATGVTGTSDLAGGQYAGDTTIGTADEPSGFGANPGPVGSAQYEGGATPSDLGGTDIDPDGNQDLTREEVASTEFGGAYGQDTTPLPTSAAWDRGEAPPEGEASFGTDDALDEGRDRGI